jgi:hypothetical protein
MRGNYLKMAENYCIVKWRDATVKCGNDCKMTGNYNVK